MSWAYSDASIRNLPALIRAPMADPGKLFIRNGDGRNPAGDAVPRKIQRRCGKELMPEATAMPTF
ncbi:MAG: hypothetical protein H0T75_22965 [Rhizobiales bacterium]|nr:hypothetical protein [Hyphomicrobiales bacterium]